MRCTSARDWGRNPTGLLMVLQRSRARKRRPSTPARISRTSWPFKLKRGFERHQRCRLTIHFANDSASRRASAFAQPGGDFDPAARRCLNPRPATAGFGSFIATHDALDVPKISAFVHGPVRPYGNTAPD